MVPIMHVHEMCFFLWVLVSLSCTPCLSGPTCFPGAFLLANGTCALCPPGMYSMQAGATSCFACMLGSYADRAGMSQCILSGMGAFVARPGQSSSLSCTQGTFQFVGGSSSCVSCSAGLYQSSVGATVCDLCQPGFFYSGGPSGASVCHACVAGSYASMEGATVCLLCSAGMFQDVPAATVCSLCRAGTMQDRVGGSSCRVCQAGTYQKYDSMTTCIACYSGAYQSQPGGTACASCPAGTLLANSGGIWLSECKHCAAGAYASSPGSSSCDECPHGSFSQIVGQTACELCSLGTYQPSPGQSACVQCRPGTYGALRGSQQEEVCVPCRSGTYSTISGAQLADACSLCPPGYFSSSTGASSVDQCVTCPLGSVPSMDRSQCLDCKNGTFCAEGSVDPVECVDEHLICNGTHVLAQPGFLPVLTGNGCSGVIPCPRGTVCHLGLPDRAGILTDHPSNDTAEDARGVYFVVFTPGPNMIQMKNTFCNASFSYGYVRIDQVGGGLSSDVEPLYWLKALDCPAGAFLLNDECMPCPAGSYSQIQGLFSQDLCFPCPLGTFAAVPGSSACAACAAGTYQSATGATACGSCSTTEFSSAGDAECSKCGETPTAREMCNGLIQDQKSLDSFFMTVRGEQDDDMCLGVGVNRFLAGPPAQLRLPVNPLLHRNVRCLHTLNVMGRPELRREWVTAHRLPRKASSLRVLPHGPAINLALCERDGLSISFVVQDEHGGYEPGFEGAEITMALVAPEGKDLLFWTQCGKKPGRVVNESETLIGTCETREFCPTMDVIARIAVSWSAGVSLRGEQALRVEREARCAPSTSWMALMELDAPGMRYFPDDLVRASIRLVNLPSKLVSVDFKVRVMDGFEFVSFHSEMSASFSLSHDRVLSVEGDCTKSSSPLLGILTFRVSSARAGVVLALRSIADSFRVKLEGGSTHSLLVSVQGYACRGDGRLVVLIHHRSVHTLVARASSPALIDWRALQSGAPQQRIRIDAVGVWNSPGVFTAIQDIQCHPLTRGALLVQSCAHIQPVQGKAGGVARLSVSTSTASTVVEIPVFVPRISNVFVVPALDRLSGRFKVLARLRFGMKLDYFGAELDVTPYLGQVPAKGVILHGEEWVCPSPLATEPLPFTVGVPALFDGSCKPTDPPALTELPFTAFLFTGGRSGVGRFTFDPSWLHPKTPSGVLILLDRKDGLSLPWTASDVVQLNQQLEERAVLTSGMQLTLDGRGMSPRYVRLGGGNLLPILPASPARLRVILASTTLVTQHDIWDLMPSSAAVAEAWLILSDDSILDVLRDPRLYWTSSGDLDVDEAEGVRSRNNGGNFTVEFGMRGIPCVRDTVVVQVYPYSTKSATLVCEGCPSVLTSRDDPLSQQFPDKFPSSVQESAFHVEYLLMDGSIRRRPCRITVEGEGVLAQGRVHGLGHGLMIVKTDSAREGLHIQVIERWIQGFAVLCNQLPCASESLRLTTSGDGARLPPFSYTPELTLALNLSLYGGMSLKTPLLDGMHLEIAGVRTAHYPFVPLLAAGNMRMTLSIHDTYRLAKEDFSVVVETLQSLMILGPPVLYQIHCSRVWEQGLYGVVGTLTNGVSHSLPVAKTLTSDGEVLFLDTQSGSVWADGAGHGWVKASFGNLSVVYAVQATQSSKYFDSVRISPALPDVWTARQDQDLPLHVDVQPEYRARAPVMQRVLRWASSVPGVVQFKNNFTRLGLLSDYYRSVRISCVLLACGVRDLVIDQQEMLVNLAPSFSGQIDLGENEGRAITPAEVGAVMSIPVFLFTEVRLKAYTVHVLFDHVGLTPLDCVGGELFQSTCQLSNFSDMFEAVANFSSSHRSGRILVAVVRGRVGLDTISRIHVLVRRVEMGDGQLLGPVAYSFSIRVGTSEAVSGFTQPYLNRAGPLLPPPLAVSTFPGESDPSSLDVCCNLVVAQTSAHLDAHFPSHFSISSIRIHPGNVSLDVADPRIQLMYDATVLEFQPEQGRFLVPPGVTWLHGRTRVTVIYTHPGTLTALQDEVEIILAEVEGLRLNPETLEIKRIHCSKDAFRNGTVSGELVLTQNLGVVPLGKTDIKRVSLEDESTVRILDILPSGQILLNGLSPGISGISIDTHRLQVRGRVLVLQQSDCFSSYDLPDPLILRSCRGHPVAVPVQGRLYDGTVISELDGLFPLSWNLVGPVMQSIPGNLSLTVLENTPLDDSVLSHVSLHMPACQGAPEVTVQAMLRTRMMACTDPFRQVADVEVDLSSGGGVVLKLVGKGMLAFYVHIRTDLPESFSCRAISTGDCSMGPDSTIIIAGTLETPLDVIDIATIRPVVKRLWGFVEVFSGISPSRAPIVAGRQGGLPSGVVDPVKTLMPSLPVVDTAALSHAASTGSRKFTLDLMTNRQRLVDFRFYSHEEELSIMFRVTDRFLVPDSDRTQIRVILPSSTRLPLLPAASPAPDGGQSVPAPHVMDGWYAVQWQGKVPPSSLDSLEFHVTTTTSVTPKIWKYSGISLGQVFHQCPRSATQEASFLLTHRIFLKHLNFEWVASRLVCAAHVPRRRIQFAGFNSSAGAGWGEVSLALESFIRVQHAREVIMSPWFETLLSTIPTPPPPLSAIRRPSWKKKRSLEAPVNLVLASRPLAYINDTQDPPSPCPPGMYFSRNGTYMHLPMHAVAGDDCYGMSCVQGYRAQDQVCVPLDVSMDVTWICVTVILSGVALVICLLCCVRMARASNASDSAPKGNAETGLGHPLPVVMHHRDDTADFGGRDPFDDVFPEHEWGCRGISDVQLDDYSATMLDDPSLHSPLPYGQFRR